MAKVGCECQVTRKTPVLEADFGIVADKKIPRRGTMFDIWLVQLCKKDTKKFTDPFLF